MDKQIIIDGVDVGGCELYRDDNGVFAPDGTAERTELCFWTNDYCGNSPNCYYKQLKRKEQECEKLKEKLSRKKAVIDFASCPSYGYRDNDIEPTCTKTFCYDVESCEYKTMIKYEQALTEIQEIAEEVGNAQYLTFPDFNLKQNVKMLMGQFNAYLQQILQKISEVLNEKI